MIKKIKSKIYQWQAFLFINAGAYLLRKGARLQVGQPVHLPAGKTPSLTGKMEVVRKKPITYWIENIFFNFKQNKITYSWSDKPIKGLSEKFINAKKG